MIDPIHDINWSEFYHFEGRADDLPDLLQKLYNSKQDTESGDWGEYHEEIFDKIDPEQVYVATEITPSIIHAWMYILITCPHDIWTSSLLGDINQFADASRLDTHYGREYRHIYEDQGRNYDLELSRSAAYVEQARATAYQYIDHYIHFLNNAYSQMQSEAALTLARFPEEATRFIPILLQHHQNSTDEIVRQNLVRAIRKLSSGSQNWPEDLYHSVVDFMMDRVRIEGHQAIGRASVWTSGFQAAMALIELLRKNSPNEAIDILGQAMIRNESLEFASSTLEQIDQERGIQVFLKALREGQSDGWYTIGEIVKPLLDFTFIYRDIWGGTVHPSNKINYLWKQNYGEPTYDENGIEVDVFLNGNDMLKKEDVGRISILTETQRTVISAIVNTEKIWEWETDLYEWYGLPSTRDELRRLLEE